MGMRSIGLGGAIIASEALHFYKIISSLDVRKKLIENENSDSVRIELKSSFLKLVATRSLSLISSVFLCAMIINPSIRLGALASGVVVLTLTGICTKLSEIALNKYPAQCERYLFTALKGFYFMSFLSQGIAWFSVLDKNNVTPSKLKLFLYAFFVKLYANLMLGVITDHGNKRKNGLLQVSIFEKVKTFIEPIQAKASRSNTLHCFLEIFKRFNQKQLDSLFGEMTPEDSSIFLSNIVNMVNLIYKEGLSVSNSTRIALNRIVFAEVLPTLRLEVITKVLQKHEKDLPAGSDIDTIALNIAEAQKTYIDSLNCLVERPLTIQQIKRILTESNCSLDDFEIPLEEFYQKLEQGLFDFRKSSLNSILSEKFIELREQFASFKEGSLEAKAKANSVKSNAVLAAVENESISGEIQKAEIFLFYYLVPLVQYRGYKEAFERIEISGSFQESLDFLSDIETRYERAEIALIKENTSLNALFYRKMDPKDPKHEGFVGLLKKPLNTADLEAAKFTLTHFSKLLSNGNLSDLQTLFAWKVIYPTYVELSQKVKDIEFVDIDSLSRMAMLRDSLLGLARLTAFCTEII